MAQPMATKAGKFLAAPPHWDPTDSFQHEAPFPPTGGWVSRDQQNRGRGRAPPRGVCEPATSNGHVTLTWATAGGFAAGHTWKRGCQGSAHRSYILPRGAHTLTDLKEETNATVLPIIGRSKDLPSGGGQPQLQISPDLGETGSH